MKSKLGLVIGGSGALGNSVITVFKRHGWRLMNVDLRENQSADSNYTLDPNAKMADQVGKVHEHVKSFS